jgi:hypothetical protein
MQVFKRGTFAIDQDHRAPELRHPLSIYVTCRLLCNRATAICASPCAIEHALVDFIGKVYANIDCSYLFENDYSFIYAYDNMAKRKCEGGANLASSGSQVPLVNFQR